MLAYILTLGRLVLAAIFAGCVAFFVNHGQISNTLAAALIVLAIIEELTDIFDGWAARRFGTVSQLGGILDPLVDSLARATIYFTMAHAGWIPHAVPLVMIARDIIVAYTRIANATVGASTSARVSGKIKAIIQGGAIPVVIAMAAPVVNGPLGPDTVNILRLTAAGILIAITVWSLFDYLCGAWPAIRRMKNL